MKFDVQKYLKLSTIHGLFYISNRSSITEKIFWIIAQTISVICTLMLFVELVIKVQNFPIVTYLSDQSISVSEINFPAVTVCPRLKLISTGSRRIGSEDRYGFHSYWFEKHSLSVIYYERLEEEQEFDYRKKFGTITYLDFLDRLENGSIKPNELKMNLLKKLQIFDLVLNRGTFEKINLTLPTHDFLDIYNKLYKEFTPDAHNVMFLLSYSYEEYISEIITPWGLCHTYNMAFSHDMLNLNSTSDDFHYQHVFRRDHNDKQIHRGHLESYPKKLSTSYQGLWVGFGYLPWDFVEDYVQNDFNGYVVLFHEPFELPSFNSKVFKVNNILRTNVVIDPQLNSIDESLYEYEPAERNCYLEDEKMLKFFKVYTKNNCENECLSNFMLSRCDCVASFVIRNSTTRICSANERSCFKNAEEDFENHKSFCKCFEPCEHLKYDYDIHTYGKAHHQAYQTVLNIGFQFQYKSNEVNQFVRKKQFTLVDFLSFVGGILGLFAGFSALSFVELIYWFTIQVAVQKYSRNDSAVHPVEKVADQKSKLAKIKELVHSYFSESSIHGFGYIFEVSRITRTLWTISILTSITICFHMIQSTRDSVPESRIVAYDDHFKEIENIPFPAVTIVPLFTFSEEFGWNLFRLNVVKLMNNESTREEFKRNITQWFLCGDMFNNYHNQVAFSIVPYIIPVIEKESQIDWFREQLSVFNQHFQVDFSEIRTLRGMGFTFNMMDADQLLNLDRISSKFKYTRNVTTKSINPSQYTKALKYPLTFGTTDQAALTIKLLKPKGFTWNCLMQTYVVHKPDDLPTFMTRRDFSPYDYGSTVDITVSPEIIRTDKYLKNLKPSERDCYFEGERSLKYFKKYTQKNCDIECRTNATKEICGCVDIEQPFEDPKELCLNISRLLESCVGTVQRELHTTFNYSPEKNCSCLPLCNSVSYNIKYYTKEDSGGNETTINVRMNMDDIILYRRYQQFTFSDVVSYVGGLLGLFAGISMLSIVEFFYFFTIRLGVNLWRGLRLR